MEGKALFLFYGLIMELTCWINKHTESQLLFNSFNTKCIGGFHFVKRKHPGQERCVHDKFMMLKQKHLSLLAPFVSARASRAELCLGSLQRNL